MQWLADISVRRPVFATVLVLSLVVVGIASFFGLGVDRFPDIQVPFVMVTTEVPGMAAAEIEEAVSIRLEDAVSGVSGLERLDSQSLDGVSIVTAQFALSRDPRHAVEDVRELVSRAQANLPPQAGTPRVETFRMNDTPVALVSLVRDRHGDAPVRSAAELTAIADQLVRQRLQSIDGIARVSLVGGRPRRFEIVPDLERLQARGLTVSSLASTLTAESVDAPGPTVLRGETREPVRLIARATDVDALRAIVIGGTGDALVRVGDVADVRDVASPAVSLASVDGEDVVLVAIRKRTGANTVSIVDAVRAQLPAIEAGLPRGVSLSLVRDESEPVVNAVHAVQEHLIVGSILAALVVLLFLRNGRATLITALAIPASIIATFGFMRAFGLTLDTVSLLGLTLAVGIVIDDAIVVLENIMRVLEERDVTPMEAAIEGTREIGLAVLATTLSLVAVFLPVAFMDGIIGRFLASFGLTMSFSILVSLFVAFTLTPMLAARWLKRTPRSEAHAAAAPDASPTVSPEDEPAFYAAVARGMRLPSGGHGSHEGAMERWYVRALALAMRHRWAVGITILAVLASTLPLAGMTSGTFLERDDDSRFEVSLRLPEGSSVDETALHADRLAARLRSLPGVRLTVVQAGGSAAEGTSRGPNEATVYVGLVPVGARDVSQFTLMDRVRDEVVPAFSTTAGGAPVPLLMVGAFDPFGASGPDAAPVQWTLRGRDLEALGRHANALLEASRSIPGTLDHALTLREGAPEATFVFDRERGAARGVTAGTVAQTMSLLSGETVLGTIPDEGGSGSIEVRMVAPEEARDLTSALLDVRVPDTRGGTVRIGDVANLAARTAPTAIRRADRMRQVTLTMSVANGYGEQGVVDALRETEAHIGIPASYRGRAAGNTQEMERTARGFLIAISLSLIFMYLVLAAQFESFTDPAIILASLPLTIPFALLSLVLGKLSLNIFSMLGILVLFGVVKKNAILQIDHVRQLRAKGMPRAQAILVGNRDRLRPILMTTIAFVVGATPLLFSTGSGAGTNQSIGAVIIGGQSLSLFLTLLSTPVLATTLEDARAWLGKRFAKGDPTLEEVVAE